MSINYQDLIKLFNALFKEPEQTILISGTTEPLYLPKNAESAFNQVIFTHDYYSSALHEIAHWCIASKERRQLVDYGYWYKPDGRTPLEQKLFEQAEVKPQAIECIFSMSAGIQFRVSADNIAGNNLVSAAFKKNLYEQILFYLKQNLPRRAALFNNALLDFYQHANIPMFSLESL